jgi:hypothetical protein
MSIYRSLDEGIPSEINVSDDPRRRGATAKPELTLPVAARDDAQRQRKAVPNNEPLAATFKWVATLPRAIRPLALLQRYPRIVNVMAQTWSDPPAFRDYMFELLIDRRGGRQGFPQNVRCELLALRAYFDEAHPHASIGLAPEIK